MRKDFSPGWDAGTPGTDDPPSRASGRALACVHMTPQVRPMRPARPSLSFNNMNQLIRWDIRMGRAGTLEMAGVRP